MKQRPNRMQIASAVDLLVQENGLVGGMSICNLPIDQIKPFHNHRFRPYQGDRLNDMVESIKTYGILTPVIVQRLEHDSYEMLAGHDRMEAAKLAGLSTLPALVKEGLSKEEALTYVIETNLMQRSFTDMLPTEQAAVLELRYSSMLCQGRRNDILRELQLLESGTSDTCGLIDQKAKSRDKLGEEYGLSPKSVSRLLRLNHLDAALGSMVDEGKLPLYAAVDLSYLTADAQHWVLEASTELHYPLNMKSVSIFKQQRDTLTREVVYALMQGALSEKAPKKAVRKVGLSKTVYEQYLRDKTEDEVQQVIEAALKAYFAA